MTALDDIKEVALNSAQRAQRAMLYIPSQPSEKELSDFRDLVLDLRADLLAFYKVAILEVRRVEESGEVAAIWKEVLSFLEPIETAWGTLRGFEPVTQSLVDDYRRTLEQVKTTVTEHYKFHAEG